MIVSPRYLDSALGEAANDESATPGHIRGVGNIKRPRAGQSHARDTPCDVVGQRDRASTWSGLSLRVNQSENRQQRTGAVGWNWSDISMLRISGKNLKRKPSVPIGDVLINNVLLSCIKVLNGLER